MAELVQITETEIPEAVTTPDVLARLTQIYEHGLPGFIIRASGLADNLAVSLDDVSKLVAEFLPELSTSVLNRPQTVAVMGKIISIGEFSISASGDFHHDHFGRFQGSPILRVHETTEGSGRVILANAGNLAADVYVSGRSSSWWQWAEDAEQLLLASLVNPDIVNPEIYSGELSAGDKLVFPVAIPPRDSHNRSGPVWHRFDACLTPRVARVQPIYLERLDIT